MCLKLHLRENILLLYMRDFEVERTGLKETSRRCSSREKLRDTVLDWEDALPPKETDLAEKHCRMADLVLCLGTRGLLSLLGFLPPLLSH
ncbi:hypothetical protein Nepgr_030913 [Nepenthes gracilis]|uniref:Uncharacterized protein n=1 Tax=Nepenthes gracilis TaxID=150966 RepID=A0AAD3Y694_NEPGR|nr:hypothetical protein Nepgr_030913 [Nepenthes gracilis]